jgi:hypothetical protein
MQAGNVPALLVGEEDDDVGRARAHRVSCRVKLEIRSSKSETNSKLEFRRLQTAGFAVSDFSHSDLFRASNFVLRNSTS